MKPIHLLIALYVCVGVACTATKPGPVPPPKPPAVVPPCALDATDTVQPMLQDPTLIGGIPANPSDWPASVYARAGNSACSSTVIGDRVLLSAGHCMSNGGTVTFSVGANKYNARCTHHSEYKNNSTADWALCLVDRPVTGIVFERLASTMNLRVGDKVRLTGYGCINAGGGGGNDGIFRIGVADVTALPSGKNYDVVTRGGAALCFGDSGGAAYYEASDGSREIFGVNSRGNIKNTSYLPALASTTMQNFATEFADANGVKICGVSSDTYFCRGDKPAPPPPPPAPIADFTIAATAGCIKGKMNPGHESKMKNLEAALKRVLDSF